MISSFCMDWSSRTLVSASLKNIAMVFQLSPALIAWNHARWSLMCGFEWERSEESSFRVCPSHSRRYFSFCYFEHSCFSFNNTYTFVRETVELNFNKTNFVWQTDRDHEYGKDVYPFSFQNGTLIDGGRRSKDSCEYFSLAIIYCTIWFRPFYIKLRTNNLTTKITMSLWFCNLLL